MNQTIPNWSASNELVQRFWELLYSAIAAVPLGFILIRMRPSFNFTATPRGERSY